MTSGYTVPTPVAITSAIADPVSSELSQNTCGCDAPSASGCFSPKIGTNASLYSSVRSGPHAITQGSAVARQIDNAVRNDWGQPSMGPNGVAAHSTRT